MPLPPTLNIDPPLLNSANPWATDLKDLRGLYECPHTGAVTTRTTLISGFVHDDAVHQHVFFDPVTGSVEGENAASLNSLGYSPLTLDEYLSFIKEITSSSQPDSKKGFIISVTGTPENVAECYIRIATAQKEISIPLAMEINLSCPNIPNAPPPAYDATSLLSYLEALNITVLSRLDLTRIPFGLKTPPYTHSTEYGVLMSGLHLSAVSNSGSVCPVSFITATNTLGSCLVLSSGAAEGAPTPCLPGSGIGGMAGAPLHPLALGNVATIRRLLDEHSEELGHIQIIGTGGVLDSGGYERMKAVGAYAVGVGTGLGLKGLNIFSDIMAGLKK